MSAARSILLVLGTVAVTLSACGGGDDEDEPGDDAPRAHSPVLAAQEGVAYQQPAGDSQAPESGGTVVADSGFRAEQHGFPFENWGGPGVGVRAQELREMFGDGVCVDPGEDPCTLTPVAEEWRRMATAANEGGRCVGFSILAVQMRLGHADPKVYGGATPYDLKLSDASGAITNVELGADLERSAAIRLVPNPGPEIRDYTPSEIVQKLREAFAGDDDNYVFGFTFGKVGHVVVAAKVIDRGDGIFEIGLYDNNYPYNPADPASSDRRFRIDTKREAWEYNISPNPDVEETRWHGGPENPPDQRLALWPERGTLLPKPCPVCDAPAPVTVALTGDPERHGHLRITDQQGRVSGYDRGRFINEIPGANVVEPLLNQIWRASPEPAYHLPQRGRYTVQLVDVPAGAPPGTIHAVGPGVGVGLAGLTEESEGTAVDLGGRNAVAVAPAGGERMQLRLAAPGNRTLLIDPADGRFAVRRAPGGDLRLAGQVSSVVAVDAASGRTTALPGDGGRLRLG